MTVETLAPGTTTLRRRPALEPYLVKLDMALCSQVGAGAAFSKLSIDGIALALEPWIAERVSPFGTALEDGSGLADLLRQCIALALKGSIDVRNLRDGVRAGSGSLYALQGELMLDGAFGSALLRELQDGIDGLVKQGELDEAKRFSKFQHQIRCVVRDMKESIAESNASPAHEVDEPIELVEPDEPDEPDEPPIEHVPAAKADGLVRAAEPVYPPTPRRRRPPPPKPASATRPTPKPRYMTGVLIVLDVVALLTCFFLTVPAKMPDKALRALTHSDFPNAAPLVDIKALPPALYATVDDKTWSVYDDKQKRHLLDGMGSVLLVNGYGGLLLKTPDGRIVGEWLETGGSRLLGADTSALAGAAAASAPTGARGVASQYSRFVP